LFQPAPVASDKPREPPRAAPQGRHPDALAAVGTKGTPAPRGTLLQLFNLRELDAGGRVLTDSLIVTIMVIIK
jgi:hypothetical protein